VASRMGRVAYVRRLSMGRVRQKRGWGVYLDGELPFFPLDWSIFG
jgi:hypothetical protein